MKICITGGLGFTGAALTERLLDDGHEVSVIDKQPGLIDEKLKAKGAKIFYASITDREAVAKAVEGCEIVQHLAAAFREIGVPDQLYYDVNVEGTKITIEEAIKAGALGYITKSSTPTVLIEAIYTVYAGDHILSPDMAQALALEKTGHEYIALQSLSTREFEIFRMLAESRSKQDISQTLNISLKTVSNCHYLIKNKLNVSSDIELIYLAIRMNVIDFFEPSRKT